MLSTRVNQEFVESYVKRMFGFKVQVELDKFANNMDQYKGTVNSRLH